MKVHGTSQPRTALHGAGGEAGGAGAQIGPRFVDDFNGDNTRLLDSTKALLELSASGAFSHPIPGLAHQLLNNLAARLEACGQ